MSQMLAALFFVLQTPTLDRSGEADLKAALEAVARLSTIRVTMVAGSRERDDNAYQMDQTLELSFGKTGQFRALGTSVWDDAFLVACDGKMLLVDPLEDGRTVTVKDAPKDIGEATNQMGRHAGYGGLFVMMRLGADAFDQLAAADVPITRKDLGSTLQIDWKSTIYTTVRMTLDKKTRLPVEIVYDDLTYRKGTGNGFRLTAAESPSTRQLLFYDPLPKGMDFSVTLPAKFTDLRKKPDAPVGTIKP